MKKTTTRIATVAAVLVTSAFAIVLAQHDARKRDASEPPTPLASMVTQPTEPLQLDSTWPTAAHAIVRGNNNQFPDQGASQASYTSNLSDEPPRYSDSYSAVPPLPNDRTPALPSGYELPGSSSLPSNDFPQPNALRDDHVGNLSESLDSPPQWPDQTMANLEPVTSGVPAGFDTDAVQAAQAQEIKSPPAWASEGASMPALPNAPPPNSSTSSSGLSNPTSPPSMAAFGNPQPMGDAPTASLSAPTPSNVPPSEQGFGSTLPALGSAASNSLGASSASLPPNSPGVGSFGAVGPRAELVSNQPGSRYLDGSQNPVLQIQKRAPEEIQVGKKATFVITVRNAGNATAHDVTVVDRIPRGARFAESSPAISPTVDGVLSWNLGEMGAGDERTINLQIIPEVEGEVGSVASVHFAAQASVRTIATLPQVMLEVEPLSPVIIGGSQQIAVLVQNTGSGVARGIRLEADIPAQLRHESGETQLEALVGDLRPNESRRLTLHVAAVQAGQSQCLLRAVNDDGVQAEKAVTADVRTPLLAATISGPSLRYLERQANYQIVVTNTGTAMARNLDFVIHLPVGLKFVSVDIPQASYNPQTHSVTLGLAELDTNQSAPFSVTVLPVQLGPQVIRFNATGDLNVAAEAKTQVTVAGLAELAFAIGQDNGTVEVGATTTYAVEVSNIGNQADRNVQLAVQLPEGSRLLQVDAPVEYQVDGNRILFAPVPEMRNRDTKVFRFQIQHNRAGNQVVRSQLTSENWPVAVVKEEGTLVYNDQN